MSSPTDAELIRRSWDRPEEFEAIFDRHVTSIMRFLRLRVGDDLAEELTAETFAQAFRARSRFSAAYSSALPWLYGIAGNLVRMHRRSEQRRLRAYAEVAGMGHQFAPDHSHAGDLSSVAPALSDGLIALPASQREVLLLHAWGELSPAEIAQALSISDGTVRKRLHRARLFLANRLVGYEGMTTKCAGQVGWSRS